ncbi:T9SS type A sorting domain-containing protein [Empedobacter sp. UBA5036]
MSRTIKYVDSKSSTIDVQSLPSGVYLLKIKTDKGMKIEKIIKK